MAGTLAPSPILQPLSDDGEIMPGALLDFFEPGTTTPKTVYQDDDLLVPHANPVVLDAAGRATIYLDAANYKVRLRTAAGVTVWTVDPVPSTAIVTSGLGDIASLDGDPNSPVTVTSYPSGSTGDDLHAGSRIWNIDSDNLASGGTFRLEAMLKGEGGGTITLALVNLSDGSPDTALVEISSSSTAGDRQVSGAITFAAGGAAKSYGIKSRVNSGAGYAWSAKVIRTA